MQAKCVLAAQEDFTCGYEAKDSEKYKQVTDHKEKCKGMETFLQFLFYPFLNLCTQVLTKKKKKTTDLCLCTVLHF